MTVQENIEGKIQTALDLAFDVSLCIRAQTAQIYVAGLGSRLIQVASFGLAKMVRD